MVAYSHSRPPPTPMYPASSRPTKIQTMPPMRLPWMSHTTPTIIRMTPRIPSKLIESFRWVTSYLKGRTHKEGYEGVEPSFLPWQGSVIPLYQYPVLQLFTFSKGLTAVYTVAVE